MPEQVTLLRVFVASPRDTQEEREIITEIISELNSYFEKEGIILKLLNGKQMPLQE